MTTAFELSDLVRRLKDKGLPVADALAKDVVESVLSWVSDSVVLTPNKYDDFALAVIPLVKPLVLAEVDKLLGSPPPAA